MGPRSKARASPGSFCPAGKGSSGVTGRRSTAAGNNSPEACYVAASRLGAPPIPAEPNTGDRPVMAVTRTFSIIKPDATRRNLTGAVTRMLEEAGLRVIASKRIRMTRDQAEGFYEVQ